MSTGLYVAPEWSLLQAYSRGYLDTKGFYDDGHITGGAVEWENRHSEVDYRIKIIDKISQAYREFSNEKVPPVYLIMENGDIIDMKKSEKWINIVPKQNSRVKLHGCVASLVDVFVLCLSHMESVGANYIPGGASIVSDESDALYLSLYSLASMRSNDCVWSRPIADTILVYAQAEGYDFNSLVEIKTRYWNRDTVDND